MVKLPFCQTLKIDLNEYLSTYSIYLQQAHLKS